MPEFIGRYQILRKLGEGGMGTVYAARDPELARDVAIKTIRRELADETMRKRMWREARAAAGINHPNICQVYEVAEIDGELFLAMELLEGESLSERLAREAPPIQSLISITIEVLAALEALHARGFVHRDLKPSNIFCTKHGAKLLDFGVVLPPDELMDKGDERLTRTGMLVGTPSFMAPEQWVGSNVGPTADIFAVGAMLFEMIAGEPAFRGENVLDLYNAIVRNPAPTLSGGRAIESIDLIVQRALAKKPEDRHASAAAMASELELILPVVDGSEVAQAKHVRRLLVLPLQLLQPDEDIDFLRTSLADALVSSLSGRDDLVVKAGGATVAEGDPDFAAIARDTGVSLVLLGTLMRSDSRLRITARLVEVPDGSVLWSETKQASMDDIFALQDELASHIAGSLALRLGAGDASPGYQDVPATGKAYEYFLRANQLSFNFGMLPAARDLYLASIEEDPDFAPAWARLGRVYRVMAKYGHGDAKDIARAKDAFLAALDLNPNLPAAHNLYAYYEIEELGRPQDAMVRLLEQARRSPTNPDLLSGLVVACRFCGLLDASVEADRRARRLDPSMATSVAYTHWMRNDFAEAMRADDEDMRWVHHYSLPMLGRIDEAIASCRRTEERTPRSIELDMLVSTRAAMERDVDTCAGAVRRVFESSFHDPEGLYFMARNATYSGDSELGFEILEKVITGGLSCDEKFATDPWLDTLRADGRLEPLVRLARERRAEATRCFHEAGGELLLGSIDTISS